MSPAKKISYFFILFIFIFIGCAHLPTSEHPMEINRVFHASFDKTWDSVLEVVKMSRGTVIAEDRSSGLIVFSLLDSQIYINIYLKNKPTIKTTIVYLKVHLTPQLIERVHKKYKESPEEILIAILEKNERNFFEMLEKISR